MERVLKRFASPAAWLLALASIALVSASAWASHASFKLIHADELQKMMSTPKAQLYVFDANTQKVRQEYGIIPGARLLSSSANYDTSSTLPANHRSRLVFYCANTMCTASHSAAERAFHAGYHHVFVMSDGIMGWKKSGHPTNSLKE